MADSIAAQTSQATPYFSYLAIFGSCTLVTVILAFAIAQSIKKENRWDVKQLVGSGGMLSSHLAIVTALAITVGLQEGQLLRYGCHAKERATAVVGSKLLSLRQ